MASRKGHPFKKTPRASNPLPSSSSSSSKSGKTPLASNPLPSSSSSSSKSGNTKLMEEVCDAEFYKDVAVWLKALGFNKELDNKQIERLCPKRDRNMWCHLMKHVRPENEADLAKKNFLLSMLEKNHKKYNRPLKAIVKKPEDFDNYMQWSDLRDEIEEKKSEVQNVTGEVRALQLKTRLKEHQIKVTKEEINDCNQKTDLLNMKIKQEETKLENLEDQVKTCEVLTNKSFALLKDESPTDKISSFVSELENLHVQQLDNNEPSPLENDLLWEKAEELVMVVPPNDIINYVESGLLSVEEKLKEEVDKYITLKASVLQPGPSDLTPLRQTLCTTFTEYKDLEKETEVLKADITTLKQEVTDNIIKKFSLNAESDRDLIMWYVNQKCALAFDEQKIKSYKKVISDMQYSDKVQSLENSHKIIASRVEQMDKRIEDKVAIFSEIIHKLLSGEGQKKIEEERNKIMQIITEFTSSENEEEGALLNLRGTLNDEISLFLKVPLQKNRLSGKPLPLPSALQYFPLNRQKHVLPLQIVAQRLQIDDAENLISHLSETELLVNQLADNSEHKLSLAKVKELKEITKAELNKKLMITVNVIEDGEKVMLKARKFAELLDKEEKFNNLLSRRDPAIAEEFVKYVETIRESLKKLNDFMAKNNLK